MLLPNLIGIHGFMRSGKDTVANMMAEEYSVKVKLSSFAKAVKIISSEATGIPLDVFYSNEKDHPYAETGLTPRHVMRSVADASKKVFGHDVFIQPLINEYKETSANGEALIITDVRFENEADWIRSVGGIILCVVRPNVSGGAHNSERGIAADDRDWNILNDGDLDVLRQTVSQFAYMFRFFRAATAEITWGIDNANTNTE